MCWRLPHLSTSRDPNTHIDLTKKKKKWSRHLVFPSTGAYSTVSAFDSSAQTQLEMTWKLLSKRTHDNTQGLLLSGKRDIQVQTQWTPLMQFTEHNHVRGCINTKPCCHRDRTQGSLLLPRPPHNVIFPRDPFHWRKPTWQLFQAILTIGACFQGGIRRTRVTFQVSLKQMNHNCDRIQT